MAPVMVFSQSSELSIFDNLVNKAWNAKGKWGDGSQFKQKINFKYSLNKSIILVNTVGFVDKEKTKMGQRNHGIRRFDEKTKTIKFWEFDVFGGLTEGEVFGEGKNIVYQYIYEGTPLTEMWEYVNDSTYNFKVGIYENSVWTQTYLNTQFEEAKPSSSNLGVR